MGSSDPSDEEGPQLVVWNPLSPLFPDDPELLDSHQQILVYHNLGAPLLNSDVSREQRIELLIDDINIRLRRLGYDIRVWYDDSLDVRRPRRAPNVPRSSLLPLSRRIR